LNRPRMEADDEPGRGAAPASRAFAVLLETARCARLLVMRIVVKKVGVGPVICRVKDMG